MDRKGVCNINEDIPYSSCFPLRVVSINNSRREKHRSDYDRNRNNFDRVKNEQDVLLDTLRNASAVNDTATVVDSIKALASTSRKNFCNHAGIILKLECLPQLVLESNPTQLSDLLWSLPRLGFKTQNKQHRGLCFVLAQKICSFDSLTARQITTSISGLATMNLEWISLPKIVQTRFFEAIVETAPTLNAREVGNLLHSISKMISWDGLPVDVREALLTSFKRQSHRMLERNGAMALYAMAMMGLDYTLLAEDPKALEAVYTVSINVLKEAVMINQPLVSQQTSNVVYGLAKMGMAVGSTLTEETAEQVQIAVRAIMPLMNEQEVTDNYDATKHYP